MTVKELHEIFKEFKTNDFQHLKTRVDWIFYTIIVLLGGTITSLVLLILKK